MNGQTLVEWSLQRGWPVDLARRLIRKDPMLSSLGQKHGPTRVFSLGDIQRVEEAINAHRKPVGTAD